MSISKLCTGGAWLIGCAALSACAGMHTTEHPAPAPPAPSAPVEAPLPPPSATDSGALQSNNDTDTTVRPDVTATPAPCSCPEVKPKPKLRPRPRPVPKEAPPQPTPTPVVGTSPGGIIDVQVKPINVSVMSILGKRVQGPNKEDLGRVVDVLADASGRVRVAIIDFGGFLGVGDHRIAVDWPLLRFNPDGGDPSLRLSVSRDKLKTAPEYKENPRPQTLTEPQAPPTPLPAESQK